MARLVTYRLGSTVRSAPTLKVPPATSTIAAPDDDGLAYRVLAMAEVDCCCACITPNDSLLIDMVLNVYFQELRWPCSAMVARCFPVAKVPCSNRGMVAYISLFSFFFFLWLTSCFPARGLATRNANPTAPEHLPTTGQETSQAGLKHRRGEVDPIPLLTLFGKSHQQCGQNLGSWSVNDGHVALLLL